jgi:two-component SAPR family response regulator
MALDPKPKVVIGLHEFPDTKQIEKRLKTMYDLEIVSDTEEAYHTIHVFKPDIAILDYTLSKIHPIELYEGIALAHPYVHFVICVTEDNYKVAQKVWKRRSCDFVFKPFTIEQFISDVNKIVRNVYDLKEIDSLKKKIKTLESEIERLRDS